MCVQCPGSPKGVRGVLGNPELDCFSAASQRFPVSVPVCGSSLGTGAVMCLSIWDTSSLFSRARLQLIYLHPFVS